MTEPRQWDPKFKYCSEAVRSHPIAWDECSGPLPKNGVRLLSLYADGALTHQSDQFDKQVGLGFVARPLGNTATGIWGFGGQVETDFSGRWNALARLQSSFNLQVNGRDRLTLAALGGLYHAPEIDAAQLGLEAALEWRLFRPMTVTLPFLSARYNFAEEVTGWTMVLGVRASLDLLPTGK